jgi:hypothetical protein
VVTTTIFSVFTFRAAGAPAACATGIAVLADSTENAVGGVVTASHVHMLAGRASDARRTTVSTLAVTAFQAGRAVRGACVLKHHLICILKYGGFTTSPARFTGARRWSLSVSPRFAIGAGVANLHRAPRAYKL